MGRRKVDIEAEAQQLLETTMTRKERTLRWALCLHLFWWGIWRRGSLRSRVPTPWKWDYFSSPYEDAYLRIEFMQGHLYYEGTWGTKWSRDNRGPRDARPVHSITDIARLKTR